MSTRLMNPSSVSAPSRPAIPRPRARTIPLAYIVSATLIGGGLAWASGREPAAVAVVVVGVAVSGGVARINARSRRTAVVQQMVATAAAAAYVWATPDPARIRLRKWSQGWPTWVQIRYSRAGAAISDETAAAIADAVGTSIGLPMTVAKLRRGRLTLEVISEQEEDEVLTAEDQRVNEVMASLLGECTPKITHDQNGAMTLIEVKHNVPVKAAAATFRGRTERTLTAVLDGRWRANWNLQQDTVTFTLRPDLPDSVPHPTTEITRKTQNLIPFGVDEDGNTVVWNLRGSGPHCLVVGKTGTGKTVTINGIVLEWIRRNWQVYICDPKRIEFLGARNWPNVRYVATTVPDMLVMIIRAHEEMERRYAAIENGADEDDFEPYLLVLDEYRNFVRQVTAWYSSVKERGMPAKCSVFDLVAAIAEKGRSARIHIVMGTQRPDAEYLGGGMRDNFDTRISNGRLSPQGAMMMWDSPHLGVAVPRGKRGRGTAITSTEQVSEVQMYWTPDPRRAQREQKQSDLAILDALLPAKATYPAVEIEWPVRIEDENWSQDAPVTWADCLEAWLVPAGTSRNHRTITPTLEMLVLPEAEAQADTDTVELGDPLPDADEDYGPEMHINILKVQVGDLLLIDEDTCQWVTVSDLEVDEDGQVVELEWRDDDDEAGGLGLDETTMVTVRRPYDLEEAE